MTAQYGIVYIAFGDRALTAARKSRDSLRGAGLASAVIGDTSTIDLGDFVIPQGMTPVQKSRWVKVSLDKLTPFRYTLYLDADVHFIGDDPKVLLSGFRMCRDGWDIVLANSSRQGHDVLGHIGKDEREQTLQQLPYEPLGLQCGVMYFSKKTAAPLFEQWRTEWRQHKEQDQAAFLRALDTVPTKLWLLGQPVWNSKKKSGYLYHEFGAAR